MSNESLDSIYSLGTEYFNAGSTKIFIFQIKENGAVIDITGSTNLVRICPIGQTDIITKLINGTITDAANGIFQCIFDGADSVSLNGVYEIQPQSIDSNGTPHLDDNGLLIISPKIGG